MIYIDKCRTDLGVTVDEWAVDDRCRFSDSGKVGIGTGVRVLDVTDKLGDVLVRLGMSVPNFSTIWNGRGEFALKYIRLIARRYSLTPEQVYKIFIFPQG